MNPVIASSWFEHASKLEDPGDHRGRLHELDNVVFMALCAVLGGADSWPDVEMFCKSKRCWTISEPACIKYLNDARKWPKLASVAMVETERRIDGETSKEARYYISSLPGQAERMLSSVRGHWGIEENSVHWVLDVSFGEDLCQVRKGNAAENFSALRRTAMTMLKRETTLKANIRAKRKRVGWDEPYPLKALRES